MTFLKIGVSGLRRASCQPVLVTFAATRKDSKHTKASRPAADRQARAGHMYVDKAVHKLPARLQAD